MFHRGVPLLAAPLLMPLLATAGQSDEARVALERYLDEVPGGQAGRIVPIADDVDRPALSGYRAFTVRFRGYPVKPPPPFETNNLFVVSPDGEIERLDDEAALERFFRKSFPSVTSDAEAQAAVKAWLDLAKELYQDGYYSFELDEASVRVDSRDDKRFVSGATRAVEGGEGRVSASLTFDAQGRIAEATTEPALKPSGDRPAGGIR